MTLCPVCSARVARKHRYCPQCGTSLDGAADGPSPLSPPGGSARDELIPATTAWLQIANGADVDGEQAGERPVRRRLRTRPPCCSMSTRKRPGSTSARRWTSSSTRSKPLEARSANCSATVLLHCSAPRWRRKITPCELAWLRSRCRGQPFPATKPAALPVPSSASASTPVRCW